MKSNKSFPFLCGIIIILQVSGCLRNQPKQILLYENNFEEKRLDIGSNGFGPLFNITPSFKGQFNPFDNSTVFGNHGTGSLILDFLDVAQHDYIKIEFDLYVHDQWEGDGINGNGEDVFILNLDQTTLYFSSIINTKCVDRNCESLQSFPNIIRTNSNPENANVEDPNLRGWCLWQNDAGGSKKIKITELYPHSGNTARIQIGADIKNTGNDLCNKSWSIDNLQITTIAIPDL